MNVSIYVRNKDYGPSCTYRICKYLDTNLFNKNNIYINQYTNGRLYKLNRDLDRFKILLYIFKIFLFITGVIKRNIQIIKDIYIRNTKIIFIQREIFPKKIPLVSYFLLKLYLNKVEIIIWDLDDYIKHSGEISKKEYDLLCEKSTHIIVSTQQLKETMPKKVENKIIILNTTDIDLIEVDTNQLNIERIKSYQETIGLLWIGTYSNITYLFDIIPELDKVANKMKGQKKIKLTIVTNGELNYKTEDLIIENIRWSTSAAITALKTSHIGLMPLKNDEFTIRKAGFKAVQYIAMGLPTLVSNVGFNKNVIIHGYNGFLIEENDLWCDKIVELCMNENQWKILSCSARKYWLREFDPLKNKQLLIKLLKLEV